MDYISREPDMQNTWLTRPIKQTYGIALFVSLLALIATAGFGALTHAVEWNETEEKMCANIDLQVLAQNAPGARTLSPIEKALVTRTKGNCNSSLTPVLLSAAVALGLAPPKQ